MARGQRKNKMNYKKMKIKHAEMHAYLRAHFTQEEFNFLSHMTQLYTRFGIAMEKASQEDAPDPERPWELDDEKLLDRWHQLGARKMKIEQEIIDNKSHILWQFSLN